MTDMQRKWRKLKEKWERGEQQDAWEQDQQPAPVTNVVPIQPKSKKMPRRVGKTARDREAKLLKASLGEMSGRSKL